MSEEVYVSSISNVFDFPQRQYFCLPLGLISYITTSPNSAYGLIKLQKTCKYFFANNKVIVAGNNINLRSVKDELYFYQNNCGNGTSIRYYFTHSIKFWLIGNLACVYGTPKKVYRVTLKRLTIIYQILYFSELKFLLNGGKIKMLELTNSIIHEDIDDGTIITFDKILEKVPYIHDLINACKIEIFSNETFGRINSLKFNSKFTFIIWEFHHISTNFNFTLL